MANYISIHNVNTIHIQAQMKPDITYGDIVVCKVKGNSIVPVLEQFDIELQFEVIGYSFADGFYILYVPQYYNIQNSWTVEKTHLSDFFIKNKFLTKKAAAIKQDHISRIITTTQNGISCSKCKKFYHLAEANQQNGTLICWSCRTNPYKL